jgi:hypothetical protein
MNKMTIYIEECFERQQKERRKMIQENVPIDLILCFYDS